MVKIVRGLNEISTAAVYIRRFS